MTVETTRRKAGPYVLDGVQTVFDYDFKIFEPEHMKAIRIVDGVESPVTGFTVTGVGLDEGTVILSPALSGGVLMLLRETPNEQATDYNNESRVRPETVEHDFDLVVMQIQELKEGLDRSVKIPISEEGSEGQLSGELADGILRIYQSADNVDLVAAGIDDVSEVAGSLSEVKTVADNMQAVIEASGSFLSLVDHSYIATASQVEFTLPVPAIADENVLVWVDGVRQVPGVDYIVSGTLMTLSAGAGAGVAVDVLIITAISSESIIAMYDEFSKASSLVRRPIVTASGVSRYTVDASGNPLDLTQTNHIVFGKAPSGPLTYGVDYTVSNGGLDLAYSPAAGELYHVLTMPRFSNSEAQVVLQDYREEIADLVDGVDEAAERAETAEGNANTAAGNAAAQVVLASDQADRAEAAADDIAVTASVVGLTFNGTQSTFALGVDIPSDADVFVTVNGVLQSTNAYNTSGQNITFLEVPPEGTGEARILGKMVRRNGGLLPGPITKYNPAWGWSASMRYAASEAQIVTSVKASDEEIKPSFAIEYNFDGDSAVGLDFTGAVGGSIMAGLYVQHRQTGDNPANNAFTHSIAGYALNDAVGDNDVIGVSGRATKRNVSGGVGDAAGLWGSAYQYSQQRGLVMAAEATVYQNAPGSAPRDRLNTHLLPGSVALHLGSYSTGSPALAIIAADGSGAGAWNYELVDGNLWSANKGAEGTVAFNGGSWSTSVGFPDIGFKFGEANWHIYRNNSGLKIGTNLFDIRNPSGGASGLRIHATTPGNAYIDLMEGETYRSQIFWDVTGARFIVGTNGAHPLELRTNSTTRVSITAEGVMLLAGTLARDYASDSAAAAGGVPVGGIYHNAGALRIRRA